MPHENQDSELVVQQDGPVVQVTMNRPQALNALSLEMIRILAAGLEQWQKDTGVKAVFIEGAGDKAFCAGGTATGPRPAAGSSWSSFFATFAIIWSSVANRPARLSGDGSEEDSIGAGGMGASPLAAPASSSPPGNGVNAAFEGAPSMSAAAIV